MSGKHSDDNTEILNFKWCCTQNIHLVIKLTFQKNNYFAENLRELEIFFIFKE